MLISSTSLSDEEDIDMELEAETPWEKQYNSESDRDSNDSFIAPSSESTQESIGS